MYHVYVHATQQRQETNINTIVLVEFVGMSPPPPPPVASPMDWTTMEVWHILSLT